MKECNYKLNYVCNSECENMKTITKEIESSFFPGFYESIFSNSDEFIDYEEEDKDELEEIVGKGNIEVEYEYIQTEDYNGWKEYMKDVSKAFLEGYVEKIIDVLPYEITEHKEFLLEVNSDNLTITSPKYYNYSTDRCWCDITTNMKTLQMIKEHTLNMKYANEYLIKRHSSCDGYISFVSNNINYWSELPIYEYEDNMITALFDALIVLSYLEDRYEYLKYFADIKIKEIIKAHWEVGEKIAKIEEINNEVEEKVNKIPYYRAFEDIIVSVAGDYSQICYAEPVITYKGKTYKGKEAFEKAIKEEL